jgi:hypothetical protein
MGRLGSGMGIFDAPRWQTSSVSIKNHTILTLLSKYRTVLTACWYMGHSKPTLPSGHLDEL